MDRSPGSTPSPQDNTSRHSLPVPDFDNPDMLVQQSVMRLKVALAILPSSDNPILREKFLDGLDWELVSQVAKTVLTSFSSNCSCRYHPHLVSLLLGNSKCWYQNCLFMQLTSSGWCHPFRSLTPWMDCKTKHFQMGLTKPTVY